MAERLILLCCAVMLQGQPSPPSLEPLYWQALADREKALGRDHVKVAESLVDLALFLQRQGNASAAEPLLVRAQAIYKGKDAEALARVLATLGDIAGGGERAEALYGESLHAHETAAVTVRLADLRERSGDLKQAGVLYRRAMKLSSSTAESAMIANNLGLVLEAQRLAGEAEQMFARAAELYEKAYGREHPEFATALMNLAGRVSARGDREAAVGMLRNAWRTLDRTVGRNHPHTIAACAALVSMLVGLDQKEEAASTQRGCNLSGPKIPIQ